VLTDQLHDLWTTTAAMATRQARAFELLEQFATKTDFIQRTVCVIGAEAFVERVVPVLNKAGLSVEALTLTPPSPTATDVLLATQDAQDDLRARLGVRIGVAPEVAHKSDVYEYVVICGHPYWRAEIAKNSLLAEKEVLTTALLDAEEATQLGIEARRANAGRSLEGIKTLAFLNELVYLPAMLALRNFVARTSSVEISMRLAPPWCGGSAWPTEMERRGFGRWHMRSHGGGALGAGGAAAFDTLGYLGFKAAHVRARMEHDEGDVREDLGFESTAKCVIDAQLEHLDGESESSSINSGSGSALATVELCWDRASEERAARAELDLHITVTASTGSVARLDLMSGVLAITEQEEEVAILASGDSEGCAFDDAWSGVAAAVLATQCERLKVAPPRALEALEVQTLADASVEVARMVDAASAADACFVSWDESSGTDFVSVQRTAAYKT